MLKHICVRYREERAAHDNGYFFFPRLYDAIVTTLEHGLTLNCKSDADLVYTESYRCHCRQKSAGGGTNIVSSSSIDVLGLGDFTQTSDGSGE